MFWSVLFKEIPVSFGDLASWDHQDVFQNRMLQYFINDLADALEMAIYRPFLFRIRKKLIWEVMERAHGEADPRFWMNIAATWRILFRKNAYPINLLSYDQHWWKARDRKLTMHSLKVKTPETV